MRLLKKMKKEIKYLSNPEKVSMADSWFDMATSNHFWMEWRFRRLISFIEQGFVTLSDNKIFEIGCGNGIVINQIRSLFNVSPDGCDLNDMALKMINIDNNEIYCYNIYDKEVELKEKYDVIILFDVIEHIKDDIGFINACLFHLKPNGKCIINVPAYTHLYSKYDKAVGHVRRYSKSLVRKKFSQIDGQALQMQYWGVALYFLALLRKGMYLFNSKNVVKNGFKPPFKIINSVFIFFSKIEKRLLKSPLFGSSLMFVFEKR